ncbi:hypothetical protein [Rhizomonospora bruguierae]|uniref:hypothetical protein n=1 Tax=Rhizomonospora bruguierae TaxID=1581705 RepID=UPI001BD09C60|nr:hypothetical protein [Micromonospora sp. NBRC 107566]
MVQRWLPAGVLVGALFGINVVARLVTRFTAKDDLDRQDVITLVTLVVIGLVFAAVAFARCRNRPLNPLLLELTVAAAVALLLSIFVGPFISGTTPFAAGAGAFFGQIWQYSAAVILGTALGVSIATLLGWDYRSRSLKRYAEAHLKAARVKPARPVRR